MQKIWTNVDRYLGGLFAPTDPQLDAALAANRQAGLPPIGVSPLQGSFLQWLVRLTGARRILEIGALGGYSTIWMARALPEGGRLVTLELNPKHAEVARANWQNAALAGRIELRIGKAADSLQALAASGAEPFDLIFIDADKPAYPDYLAWSLRLVRPGALIVADNVVRKGNILDPASPDPDVQGVRRFLEMLAAEPRLSATVLPTAGAKGYDGFALALVLA